MEGISWARIGCNEWSPGR